MGLARHANTRDANEDEIVEVLEFLGASVERIDVPCDLIVGVWDNELERPVTILLEVKRKGHRATPKQRKFWTTFRGYGAIVNTPEEAVEAVFGPSAIVGKDCR